jgi:hypothetical protein
MASEGWIQSPPAMGSFCVSRTAIGSNIAKTPCQGKIHKMQYYIAIHEKQIIYYAVNPDFSPRVWATFHSLDPPISVNLRASASPEAALAATSCAPRRQPWEKREVEIRLKPRQGRHHYDGPSVTLMWSRSNRDSHYAPRKPTAGAVDQMMTPATPAFEIFVSGLMRPWPQGWASGA